MCVAEKRKWIKDNIWIRIDMAWQLMVNQRVERCKLHLMLCVPFKGSWPQQGEWGQECSSSWICQALSPVNSYIILQRECCLLNLSGASTLIHLSVDYFSQVLTSRESTFPKVQKSATSARSSSWWRSWGYPGLWHESPGQVSELWFLKCGPQNESSDIAGELIRNIGHSIWILIRIHILTRPPGDSHTSSSLGSTAVQYRQWRNSVIRECFSTCLTRNSSMTHHAHLLW